MGDTDDSLQFSEDDVRQQLDKLGYRNIPASHLRQFAEDLDRLIRDDATERWSEVSTDSDYSADDLRMPFRIPQHPSSVVGKRSVSSAPSTSQQRKPIPSKTRPPTRPESSPRTNYPARHPRPFSYKYGDTSPVGLDTMEDSTPGRERHDMRRSRGEKPAMKRKVVRKMNGQAQVFDESITESESAQAGDLRDVDDRLSRLALRQDASRTEEDDNDADPTDDASSLMGLIYTTGRPQSSRDLYSHRPAGDENTVFKPHLPRSFIRPDSAQPRTKHDKKTDPVSRHQMYRAEWNSHRAPGEKNRNDLRWSIREQMMYKDAMAYPRRTPRVYSANNYVVPTDKKRQALRWAVRTSLANKQMPASTFY